MKKGTHVIIVLISLCTCLQLTAQSFLHGRDSLLSILQTAKADSNKVTTLLKLSSFYLHNPGTKVNGIDSSLLFSKQGLQLSSALKFSPGIFRSNKLIIQAYIEKKDSVSLRSMLKNVNEETKIFLLIKWAAFLSNSNTLTQV